MEFKNEFLLDLEEMANRPKTEGHPVFNILNEMHEPNNPKSTPSKTVE